MQQFKSFSTWAEVITATYQSVALWYHAPLDLLPVRVRIVRVYKNGKIRVSPWSRGNAFTADAGHLSRFRAMVCD